MSIETERPVLTERQRRERLYHEEFAQRHRDILDRPVALDLILPGPRRPWNGHWSTYDALLAQSLAGKKVLVPGCGFGDDVIRLARLGADVHGSDISPDLLVIARERAARAGVTTVRFDVMAAESLSCPDDSFDLVYFNDILHHVDIARTVAETRRVLRPGGSVIANELYTHSSLQKLRNSRFVSGFLYHRMVRFIYGTDRPYITPDEHKIDEHELALLEAILQPPVRYGYFLMLSGRLFPQRWTAVAKFDRAVLRFGAGRLLAGRMLVVGTVRK